MARPRRGLHAAAAILLVCLLASATPAHAASIAQLRRAQDRVRTLTTKIAVQERAVARTEGRLNRLDSSIERVVSHLVVLQRRTREVHAEVDRLQARLDTLQRRLNDLANSAYMNQPGGQLGMVLGLVLGSGSFIELTDGIEYASRISHETEVVASRIAITRSRMSARLAALRALGSEKARLLSRLRRQRDRVHGLQQEHQRALDALSATRERIIGIVRSLKRKLAAELFPLVGRAFQGGAHTSYGRWGVLFLQSLGAPVCHSNEVVMVAWQLAEFTQAAWNPLATTRPMLGSTTFNGAGVQNYPSLGTGLLANKLTLYNGASSYGYGAIVANLRSCSGPYATANAIRASAWCHGCAGGGYVVNKIAEVSADFVLYASF